MSNRHQCPRCGAHEPRPCRRADALCDGCQHSPQNPRYVYAAARTELRRLAVNPDPELAPVGRMVMRGGIRRWVAA